MELLTITIVLLKNHSIKCLSVLKLQRKYLNILIGNNIELPKEKNSTIMLWLENHNGNFLIKLKNIELN